MLFTRSLSVGLWALWRRGALGKEDPSPPPHAQATETRV